VCAFGAFAQGTGTATGTTPTVEKPKKAPIFRANKDQITQVQTKLKAASLYSGEATGKLDKDTRASIKTWQGSNGLRQTGTLNRATLEKMSIELTDKQKEIPVSDNSFASAETEKKPKKEKAAKAATAGETTTKKRTIFRATKDQINAAQSKLKAENHYTGEQTGKLDDATRAGLKKFQEASGLKVTGTLNKVTLEKMNIELTEKQKVDAAASTESN
jgi:peptidoglycan hydrolase-like protein with peptidoglycan-binding domain